MGGWMWARLSHLLIIQLSYNPGNHEAMVKKYSEKPCEEKDKKEN
jgi:hypothetical protein